MVDDRERAELPVVPGEIVGWRAWIVQLAGLREPRLRSLYFDVVWPTDRWLEAEGWHGICAGRDRTHLATLHRYGDERWNRYVEEAGVVVIGEVGLAGVIYPGVRGYRAERARVISLVVPHKHWELVAPLRRDYRVPVRLGNVLLRGGQHG